VQAKVQREKGWNRKSAISVRAAEIAETVLSSKEPVIGDTAVVEPPLAIHDTQPQDPQPPQSPLHAQPGDLDLPLHPHPIVEPSLQPSQADSVPNMSAIRKEVRRVFSDEENDAWNARVCAIPCRETCLLCCRLRVRASVGSHTCEIFLVVF
jgi:hypothetical protein